MSKAKDFEVDFGSGLLTCCMDVIFEHGEQEVKGGDELYCEECGAIMVLERCGDGVLRWRSVE